MDDSEFLTFVADRLAGLARVEAVALGGSRAEATHRADSDWDFAIYYRGPFEPQELRDLGWPGQVSELGGWGGGVFNGGAWLEVEDRRVDVHYRDLVVVEGELTRAERGEFHIEPLMFHLAGIPSYLVLAELAINQVLRGSMPRPTYPEALRAAARDVWWDRADLTLTYALEQLAPHGRATQCAGLLATGACQAAHGIMAGRGEWVTNEKALLGRAGLTEVDGVLAGLGSTPTDLLTAVGDVRRLVERKV